ncbi:MAG: hypothetical protein H8D56_07815 [Planctomycetes bacterium]|nr:hypothetical protein [Planctomycetota bacterium]MBL7145327.1 hypothetical protein [Phycisphaerae bacterium]
MSKKVFLIASLLLCAAVAAQAEDSQLGVTLDFTYLSKWMVKGSEGYGQQGALLKTIDLDLWGTGFGTAFTHREATASGYVDKERLEPALYYHNGLFSDDPYAIKYKVQWTYKSYPNRARDVGNTQEWMFAVSWPKILPDGLVPKYEAYYEYPAGSNYDNSDFTGWFHIFGLGYDLAVTPVLPEMTEQILHLSVSIAYRDGLGGRAIDHDWSHVTFGLSTGVQITDNLVLVPTLYHQISMDDSVCRNDVTYCKLSAKYKF